MPRNAVGLVRRMALSHAEFPRSLPAATAGMECRIDGTRILLLDPPRRVEIHLRGLLTLGKLFRRAGEAIDLAARTLTRAFRS